MQIPDWMKSWLPVSRVTIGWVDRGVVVANYLWLGQRTVMLYVGAGEEADGHLVAASLAEEIQERCPTIPVCVVRMSTGLSPIGEVKISDQAN